MPATTRTIPRRRTQIANSGYVHADALAVQAQTTGRLTSASVAAVVTEPNDPGQEHCQADWESVLEAASFASPARSVQLPTSALKRRPRLTQQQLKTKPSISIDIAGSTSANIVSLDTTSAITGATIARYSTGTTDKVDVLVEALNNAIISAGSGAAARLISPVAVRPRWRSAAPSPSVFSTTCHDGDDRLDVDRQCRQRGGRARWQQRRDADRPRHVGGDREFRLLNVNVGVGRHHQRQRQCRDQELRPSPETAAAAASGRQVVVQSYQETDIAIGGGSLAIGNSGRDRLLRSPMPKYGDPSTWSVRRRRAALLRRGISQMQNVTVAAGKHASRSSPAPRPRPAASTRTVWPVHWSSPTSANSVTGQHRRRCGEPRYDQRVRLGRRRCRQRLQQRDVVDFAEALDGA